MPTTQIERRYRPSHSDFSKEFLYPRKPVVITGALDSWTARTRWTPEFFKERYGDVPLRVEGQTYTLGGFLPHKDDGTPLMLGELVDLVLASTEKIQPPICATCTLKNFFRNSMPTCSLCRNTLIPIGSTAP